jgi:phage tail sheath protein FI
VTVTNADASVTYQAGTDYSLDTMAGTLTRLPGGAIGAGATVQVAYDRPAPELVTAGDIIGTVTVAGDRTGMQGWRDCANQMGFRPRLLCAPGFSPLDAVAAELRVAANTLRGFALIDAPVGVTPQQVLAGRGPDGAIAFDTASERAVLLYPHLEVYDAATNANALEPYSARFAGAWSAQMVERGYWWSPSNRELRGVVGIERKLTAGISDPSSEVNILNEAGITTLFNAFGTGLRTWGNRTAAWPTVTHPRNFMSVRVTADVIEESIEQTMLQFLDRPGTPAMVDAVVQTVEAGLRDMAADGAIMPEFRVWFDAAKNSPTQLGLGHYTFSYDFMPPTPMERITFDVGIDLTLLGSLTAQ